MKRYSYIPLFCLLLILAQSCREEGCADPKALNFDATADEDDGSCIYCSDGATEVFFMRQDTLTETRFGTGLFLEPIFEMSINQTQITGIILNCPDSEPFCGTNIYLKNISEFEMVNFDVSVNIQGPQVFNSFFVDNINLESGSDTIVFSQDIDLTFQNCPSYEEIFIEHQIFSGIYIE